MSQRDPTDNALAAIASILEQPQRETEQVVEEKATTPEALEAEGYSKIGPGPMAAIRFKWTVRRDHSGDYYVDETIGNNSVPIVNGPMTKEAAIRFVDDSEREALERFHRLKAEMTARSPVAPLRSEGGSGER